jgi:hypothetical protein
MSLTEATYVDQLVGEVPETEEVASEIRRALSDSLAAVAG